MRDFPKQMGMRIGETREAWETGALDMKVCTDCPITIERKGATDYVFHFLACGKTWGEYATWYRYIGFSEKEARRRFRREYGLIGAHLSFRAS